jgi:hypothetical protein
MRTTTFHVPFAPEQAGEFRGAAKGCNPYAVALVGHDGARRGANAPKTESAQIVHMPLLREYAGN